MYNILKELGDALVRDLNDVITYNNVIIFNTFKCKDNTKENIILVQRFKKDNIEFLELPIYIGNCTEYELTYSNLKNIYVQIILSWLDKI